MSAPVHVLGAGAVSALGGSLSEAAGRAADDCPFAGPAGERAAYPAGFDPRRDLAGVPGARRLGRQAAMALAAALEASRSVTTLPEETALFFGTAHGAVGETIAFLESARADAGRYASPKAFSGSLHASVVAPITQALGIRGSMLVVSDGVRSFETALSAAMELLGRGEAPCALVGACDAYHPHVREAIAVCGGVSGSSRPLDREMEHCERGTHLGEGAGFVVVAPDPDGASDVRITRVEVAAPRIPETAGLDRILALADGSAHSARLHAAAVGTPMEGDPRHVPVTYPVWRLGAFGSLSAVVVAQEAHRRMQATSGEGASLVVGAAIDGVSCVVLEGHGGGA